MAFPFCWESVLGRHLRVPLCYARRDMIGWNLMSAQAVFAFFLLSLQEVFLEAARLTEAEILLENPRAEIFGFNAYP